MLLSVVVLLAAGQVCAETYTYRDANGTVAYVEDLGKVPPKYRDKAVPLGEMESLSVMEPVPAAGKAGAGKRQSGRAAAAEKKRFNGTIEMYVTDWCPHCKNAESYVSKMGYSYVKYDVEKDSDAKRRSDSYPGRGVPLIIVGDRNFRGFSPETLESFMSN